MTSPFADEPLAAFVAASSQTFGELDVAQLRAGIAERAQTRAPGPELHAVSDLHVGERPARLYRPRATRAALVLYRHGGGWTIGSVESHDRRCRRLAARSGVAVLSLGYRLAPSTRGPPPWRTRALGCDGSLVTRRSSATPPARVAVGGDSAGGTLGALACLRLRDEAPTALPDLQMLLYANTDLAAFTLRCARRRKAGARRGDDRLLQRPADRRPACAAVADRVADDLRVRLGGV